jgi:hypothetical protein
MKVQPSIYSIDGMLHVWNMIWWYRLYRDDWGEQAMPLALKSPMAQIAHRWDRRSCNAVWGSSRKLCNDASGASREPHRVSLCKVRRNHVSMSWLWVAPNPIFCWPDDFELRKLAWLMARVFSFVQVHVLTIDHIQQVQWDICLKMRSRRSRLLHIRFQSDVSTMLSRHHLRLHQRHRNRHLFGSAHRGGWFTIVANHGDTMGRPWETNRKYEVKHVTFFFVLRRFNGNSIYQFPILHELMICDILIRVRRTGTIAAWLFAMPSWGGDDLAIYETHPHYSCVFMSIHVNIDV